MAEFVVSAKLTAKNEASVPLKQVQGDLKGVTEATKGLKPANDAAAQGMAGLARAMSAVAVAARAEKQALDAAAAAARTKQQSVRMLGIQMGDFGTQVAAGINPVVAFGQQLGQMGLAAEGLGGKLGKVATFLSSPWGAALQFAAIVAATLASKLLTTGKAAEDAAKGTDFHRMSIRDLIKAIQDQDAALSKALITGQEAEWQTARNAKAALVEAQNRRIATKALLEQAIAEEEVNRTRATAPGQRGELAAIPLEVSSNRVAALQARLAELNKTIDQGRNALTSALVPLVNRFTEEGLDPAKKAAGELERALGRLRAEYQKGGESAAEYSRKQALVRAEYARTVKAIEDANKSVTSNQIGRTLSLGGAKSLIASIGGTVTSGFRTPEHNREVGGVPNSAHLSGQALDIAKTAGMSLAKIRDAFREAGVSIRELLDEGDHFHVAWGKASNTAQTAARSAKKAEDDLSQSLADVTRRFDPAAEAAASYRKELEQIAKLVAAHKITPDQATDYRVAALRASAKATDAIDAAKTKEIIDGMGGDLGSLFMTSIDAYLDRAQKGVVEHLLPGMEDAGRAGGKAFERAGIEAAREISAAIGGKVGHIFGDIFGTITGLQTGNFDGVGGRLGAVLNLLSGNGDPNDPLGKSFSNAIRPLTRSVDGNLTKIGSALQGLGEAMPLIGASMAGASTMRASSVSAATS
jgi:hypothetical protein